MAWHGCGWLAGCAMAVAVPWLWLAHGMAVPWLAHRLISHRHAVIGHLEAFIHILDGRGPFGSNNPPL